MPIELIAVVLSQITTVEKPDMDGVGTQEVCHDGSGVESDTTKGRMDAGAAGPVSGDHLTVRGPA